MRQPDEARKELVRQWIAKADMDMRASDLMLATEPPLTYPACFHAQQAAEKYIKAFLTWHEIDFPKTHVVELLLDLLEPTSPDMAAALNGASALTDYGVDIRYPGEQKDPDLPLACSMVELAHGVRKTVLAALPAM
jgi:HEPN domain-containing protein